MVRQLRRPAVALLSLAVSTLSIGQSSPQHQLPPPPGGQMPMPKPVNLQILPKDIQPVELMSLMRQYTGQLGVECNHCHVQDPQTHRLNFASDDNMEKTSARIMIVMTREMNEKYVSKVPGADRTVNCGTCHRGMPVPPLFNPPPEKDHHGPPPK